MRSSSACQRSRCTPRSSPMAAAARSGAASSMSTLARLHRARPELTLTAPGIRNAASRTPLDHPCEAPLQPSSEEASARSCCSPIPRREALADARELELALAVMTLLGLLLVASRRGRRPDALRSRWLGSTKPRAGWPQANMCRCGYAASDELAAATSFNDMVGKIPSASSASPSSPSTTC